MSQITFVGLVAAIFVSAPVLAQVSLCAGRNPYLFPATGETGGCISNDKANNFPLASFAWHCPWESDGLVSGFGCDGFKYDCADATNTALLLQYYQGKAAAPLEWSADRLQYTMTCINHYCNAGPAPGPMPPAQPLPAAPPSTAPCNPSTCAAGLTCANGKCCTAGDWSCCGVGPARLTARLYCPSGGGVNYFNVMCNDGDCVATEAKCTTGVKFGRTACAATARLLVSV